MLFESSQAGGAEMKYKSAALRDPFVDPSEEKPVDDSAKVEASMRALTIQGVIISGENKSVIINGSIHRVGNKIGLGEIKEIDRNSVVILYKEKEIKLQIIKRKPSNEKKAGSAIAIQKK